MAEARRRTWVGWTTVAPVLALVATVLTWVFHVDPPALLAGGIALLLVAAVLAAVHHAEVIALRVGEPFGSLILAVAVTVIEVGLIVSLMATGAKDASTLARDTVFAAVMITCNGIVGLALLAGTRGGRVVHFNSEGSTGAFATVVAVTTLCLVAPTFTTSATGPRFTPAQLVFAGALSLGLYVLFVLTQTVRHRDFFLPVAADGQAMEAGDLHHGDPPGGRETLLSAVLLLVSLVSVVGLAKVESKPLEELIAAAGLPAALTGVVIALVVLAPETLAAVRSARRGLLQISLNLAYGSAMASVGLTIPVLAFASPLLPVPLDLGLGGLQLVLLALTVAIGVLTVVQQRATKLQGGLHLAVFATWLFLAANP